MIRFASDLNTQLSWFIGEGVVQLADLKEILGQFYGNRPTANTIWDMTGADLSDFTLDQIEELVQFVKEHSPGLHGKNAVIASDPFSYTLGEMFQIFAELAGQKSRTKVFRTRGEAEEWLRD